MQAGNPADFGVSLSGKCGFPVVVSYEIEDGSASAALQGDPQYGSVSIGSGSTGATIAVGTINDGLYEPNGEYFYVQLTGASSITLGTPSVAGASVQNNVAEPSVSISGPGGAVQAGNAASFGVSLSGKCGFPVVVSYELEDGSASAALQGDPQYGSVTIGSGSTGATIAIGTINDGLYEPNGEYFYVQLTGAGSVTLGSPRVAGGQTYRTMSRSLP